MSWTCRNFFGCLTLSQRIPPSSPPLHLASPSFPGHTRPEPVRRLHLVFPGEFEDIKHLFTISRPIMILAQDPEGTFGMFLD